MIPPGARRFGLLAYGDPNIDLVFAVDRAPAADEKVLGRHLGRHAGGTAANVACAAARLGLPTAAYGRVGRDNGDGDHLVAEFQRFGVAPQWVRRVAGPCATALILVQGDGEKALVYAPLPGWPLDTATLAPALEQSRVVYAMPYDLAEFEIVSREARAAGTLVAIDVEAAVVPGPERLAALLPLCDIVFFNEGGFRAATGLPPTPEHARALLKQGPELVVVTLGARGAIAVRGDESVIQPAFPAHLVDATGAGDCFNAAVLARLLGGDSLADALRFAAAAASLAITAIGARAGFPDHAAVASVLDSANQGASTPLSDTSPQNRPGERPHNQVST
ncbi:PfkB family carbohydrate kinase [Nitrospirillum amazonense]|uniref:carbohydrate kinase family protein n=1 Tax=Nitrospirillum amazonense TaxID=28077 RepID=UPI002DD44100|nr:PfkB family carbohydrate kinase [Nitrospirillum amazonense]MEC4593829.1 PfkB family carbohydrate kinase [Nitrospirillum amazonense]